MHGLSLKDCLQHNCLQHNKHVDFLERYSKWTSQCPVLVFVPLRQYSKYL